jgi:hypothetical protein
MPPGRERDIHQRIISPNQISILCMEKCKVAAK